MTPKPRREARATRDPLRFREALAEWFSRHGRDLPWRRMHTPYVVLVSEIMLQQTQVATVLAGGHFERFLEWFPDLESLAAADDDRLLKAWEGLGYYRRARQLRESARAIIRDHAGRFPNDLDHLLALPGVGRPLKEGFANLPIDVLHEVFPSERSELTILQGGIRHFQIANFLFEKLEETVVHCGLDENPFRRNATLPSIQKTTFAENFSNPF